MDENTKIELLSKLFKSFQNGLSSVKAETPRKYIESLGLDVAKSGLGFNSGQFHHRTSKDFKEKYTSIGVLTHNPKIAVNKKGLTPYTVFGAYSIVYPLRNEWGEIVNLFADRFKLANPIRTYLNDKGVFPSYPNKEARELFVCDDPPETLSLIQSGILQDHQFCISMHDGDINRSIHEIIELGEFERVYIVTSFQKNPVQQLIKAEFPKQDLILIDLEEKNLNEYLKTKSFKELRALIDKKESELSIKSNGKLEVVNPQKLRFDGNQGTFEVVGRLSMDLGQLRVSLRIIEKDTKKVHRCKIDLFDTQDLSGKISLLAQNFDPNKLESDLLRLTELLEDYRDKLYKEDLSSNITESSNLLEELTPQSKQEAQDFLMQKNLFKAIDKLIEHSGIIGEEASRKTAFVIASSYKQPYPMHGLIQASSGKGKSHLINSIASLMPNEDVINLSRITSRSLYNYHNDELINKLILIQDEDGLDEESLYAFRELQSAGFLTSSTSTKNAFGKHQSRVTRVNAHFASLMASTKTEIYADNESRSIIVGIDESDEQTLRIIEYTNKIRAGLIEKKSQEKAKQLLKNCIRILKTSEVINPFAHLIKLPKEAKTLRRLNSQFQDFVCQITILHQFQRKQDSQGRLIATKEDMEIAIDTFFSAILFKVDELDSSTRQLFEKLKSYLQGTAKGKKHEFTRREIREALNLKKTRAGEFFQHLQEMEFISICAGSSNRGFHYKIDSWDERLDRLKNKIRKEFQLQLASLKQTA